MIALFRRHSSRFARPSRARRHRPAAAGLGPERLEQRIALAADTAARPQLEAATSLYVDQSMMGPAAIVFGKSEIVGSDVKSFVVTSVANGVVEKWDAATNTWRDVSTKPTSSNPRELMRLLSNRVIRPGDQLRWLPQSASLPVSREAFKIINWEVATEPSSSALAGVPDAVRNLTARVTETTGQLQIDWEPGTGHPVDSYGVRVTNAAGSRTFVVKDSTLLLDDLPLGSKCEIEVWAANAAGGGTTARITAVLPAVRLGPRIDNFWELNQSLLASDPVDELGSPLVSPRSGWGGTLVFPGVSYDSIMAATESNPAAVPSLVLPNEILTAANLEDGFTVSMWVQARGPGMLLSAELNDSGSTVTVPYLWIAPSGNVVAGFYGPTAGVEYSDTSSILSWVDATGTERIGSAQAIESLATVIDGSWHQITFTAKNNTQALYIDGLLQGVNYAAIYQQQASPQSWNRESEAYTWTIPLDLPQHSTTLNLQLFQGDASQSPSRTKTYTAQGIIPLPVSPQDSTQTRTSPLTLIPTDLVSGSIYTTVTEASIISTVDGYSLQLTASSQPAEGSPLEIAIEYLPGASGAFSVTPVGLGPIQSVNTGASVFPFMEGIPAPQTNYPQPYRGAVADLAVWQTDLSSVNVQAIATAPVTDLIAGSQTPRYYPGGAEVAPVPQPVYLYTFEDSAALGSITNVAPDSTASDATTNGLIVGAQATIPVPFEGVAWLPGHRDFGLGLMAPLASGFFSLSPPTGDSSSVTQEVQVSLAAGDQLTLQRSNINESPVLDLSIVDDLGQVLLQNDYFTGPDSDSDNIYTLTAPRTGSYKITVRWGVHNGENAGNWQPIRIDYVMTPGSGNSFQSLFVNFKDIFAVNDDAVFATYSSPLLPTINPQSNDNVAPASATGAANYFPLWSDSRYFPESPNYTPSDLSEAFVAMQEQVGYSVADLNGITEYTPAQLSNDLAAAYAALQPVYSNTFALAAVNSFFEKVNTYRQAVYQALEKVWVALESLPSSIDYATTIASTISENQAGFVVSETAGPPNINPHPQNFGALFGKSLEHRVLKSVIKTAIRKGSPITKAAAGTAALGLGVMSASKKAGTGSTVQNSVLVNLLPVMNSQVLYEQLENLGQDIDDNIVGVLSHQEEALQSSPYLNSIFSNFALLELMQGMSGEIYGTTEAQQSIVDAAKEISSAQAWSTMIPDVFTWEPVDATNWPIDSWNFSQFPFSSVQWSTQQPNVPQGMSATNPTWMAIGDLNQDFIPDIVTSNNGSSSLSVLLAQPNPQWNPTPSDRVVGYDANSEQGWNYTNVFGESSTVPVQATSPSGIAIADFDQDGTNEVLVASVANNSLYLVKVNVATVSTGSTTISVGAQAEISLPGGSNSEQPQQVVVSDLNNDGYPDFVVACEGGGNVVYGINSPEIPGTFSTYVAGNIGNGTLRWVTAGDLTEDGYPDLVAISSKTGGINAIDATLLINNGGSDSSLFDSPTTAFSLSSTSLIQDSYMATNAVIGDFNGDGYEDIAFGFNETNSYYVGGAVQFVFGNQSGAWSTNSSYQSSMQTNIISGLAVLPAARMPGFNEDVVIANYGAMGQYLVFPSGSVIVGSGSVGGGTLGVTNSVNSQIVVDPDSGLIAISNVASQKSPATAVTYTTQQAAQWAGATIVSATDSAKLHARLVEYFGREQAGELEAYVTQLLASSGVSESLAEESGFGLWVESLLQDLHSGEFVRMGLAETAGVGSPGFFVAALDVRSDSSAVNLPDGSMGFMGWNLVDENGNPIALETLQLLVGNIGPATDSEGNVLPTIAPYRWSGQAVDPVNRLQPAVAYDGVWFALAQQFDNAVTTLPEMFFEWGRGVPNYSPGTPSPAVVQGGYAYSPASTSPPSLPMATAPVGLAAVPGPGSGQVALSWQRPQLVYGGADAAVTYIVTVQNGDAVQTLTSTNTQLTVGGINYSDPLSVSVQARVAGGMGMVAQLDVPTL